MIQCVFLARLSMHLLLQGDQIRKLLLYSLFNLVFHFVKIVLNF